MSLEGGTSMWPKIITDGIPARYKLAIMAFFGFVFNYMLRINISIAIVAMVNHTAIALHADDDSEAARSIVHNECVHQLSPNSSAMPITILRNEDSGEFAWDEKTQALIIGSFFWGYILTQLPGGRLAEMFGSKYIFGFSIFLAGLVNILIPFVAQADPTGMIALRVILGIVEGATYPSMHAMLAKWAPPDERSRISSIVYSGSQAGTVIAFPLAGLLINMWGWRSVFMVMGAASFIWTLIWMLFAYDSPDDHPSLSLKEMQLLCQNKDNMAKSGRNNTVPWKAIVTSGPLWAIIASSICSGWGFWTFLHQLPTYMKTILGFDMKKNSLLSALPYVVMWMFGLIYGNFADRLKRDGYLSTGMVRKVSTFFCLILPALCLIALTFVGCDPLITVSLFTIAIGFSGAKYSAYLTNHIDIAPNYAGTLLGLANCFATIPGWTAPLVAGALTNGQQTLDRWHIVFYIAAGVYMVGFLIYALLGSGEVQEWNEPEGTDNKEQMPAKAMSSTETMFSVISLPREDV